MPNKGVNHGRTVTVHSEFANVAQKRQGELDSSYLLCQEVGMQRGDLWGFLNGIWNWVLFRDKPLTSLEEVVRGIVSILFPTPPPQLIINASWFLSRRLHQSSFFISHLIFNLSLMPIDSTLKTYVEPVTAATTLHQASVTCTAMVTPGLGLFF